MHDSKSLARTLNNSDLSSSFRQKKLRMILFAVMSAVSALELREGVISSAYAQSEAQQQALVLGSSTKGLKPNQPSQLVLDRTRGSSWTNRNKNLPARTHEWEGMVTSKQNRDNKDIASSVLLEGEEDRTLHFDHLTGRMILAGGKVTVKGIGANRLKQFRLEGNAILDISNITRPSMSLNNFSSAADTTIILGNKTLKVVFTGD